MARSTRRQAAPADVAPLGRRCRPRRGRSGALVAPFALALAWAPAVAPLGCGSDPPPSLSVATLPRGDYSLRVTDGTIVLLAGVEERLTLPREALELGLVAEVSDSAS
ncbi:MAG TPA: hypothetical protein PK141_14760, partial [Polyangiaceae bacterium]|nr:hypothetical protein [Polyangiaceae bacterium]